jgi:hypothetical protein
MLTAIPATLETAVKRVGLAVMMPGFRACDRDGDVDYDSPSVPLIDPDSGENTRAHIFVAV